jgi:hypothetical protein
MQRLGGKAMRSSSGRELFNLAQVYRAVYALRADYDRQPVLTVPAAIAYGEFLLRSGRLYTPTGRAISAK